MKKTSNVNSKQKKDAKQIQVKNDISNVISVKKKDSTEGKENFRITNKTETLGKTLKKEIFNPNDYEKTTSVLLSKQIRNLDEENEKINLLKEETRNMEVDISNLMTKRAEAQKALELKFEDVYSNIEATKHFVLHEGKKIRNELYSFQNLFDKNIKELDQKHINLNDQLDAKVCDKFNQVDKFASDLENALKKEEEDRKEQFKNMLDKFEGRIGDLENKITREENTRTFENEDLRMKLELTNTEFLKNIKSERDSRTQENAILKKDFWYELNALSNNTERNHDKIVTEFNHITVNLQKEIQHRLTQQDDLIDNLSNVVSTIQKTLDILKQT